MLDAHRRRALCRLVGLPPRSTARASPGAMPRRFTIPLDELLAALDLDRPPYAELLAADRWLAGGAVLRWLCGDALGNGGDGGDYDYFLPSVGVFDVTARSLLEQGFTFRCFRSREPMCQLCGRPGTIDPDGTLEDPFLPLYRIRCRVCGAFGGRDAATLGPARLLRLNRSLIEARGIFALELRSPRGDLVHLSAIGIGPSPQEVIARFDFSIVQLALDHRRLYAGPHTIPDLLAGRLRLGYEESFEVTLPRLRKYAELGFRPYLGTVLLVLAGHLRARCRRALAA